MPRPLIYRRQLLRAVEAFLEGTASSHARAHRIIKRCYASIYKEDKANTIDQIIWGNYLSPLTDSIFYEDETYLRKTQEILLGQASEPLVRAVVSEDFRSFFTNDESAWYTHLVNMVEFIEHIPFAEIHEVTFPAWREKTTWAVQRKLIPEVTQAEEIDAEYERRKMLIEDIVVRIPLAQHLGDKKVYHLLLGEVTTLMTGLRVGMSAVIYGYPILLPPYSGLTSNGSDLDMSESVKWSKRTLEAIAGKGGMVLTLRLGKASTFGSDVLVISLS